MSDQNNNNNNNSQGGQLNIPFPTVNSPGGGWFTITFPTTSAPAEEVHISEIDFAVPVEKKKINRDGCRCKKCKEFYPFAESNQPDGTLICWCCRHNC